MGVCHSQHFWILQNGRSNVATIIMSGFPKIRGTIIGVAEIRIFVFWGLHGYTGMTNPN